MAGRWLGWDGMATKSRRSKSSIWMTVLAPEYNEGVAMVQNGAVRKALCRDGTDANFATDRRFTGTGWRCCSTR